MPTNKNQIPWSEKYRPNYYKEVHGQDQAIEKIKKFISDFHLNKLTRGAKKALILHGPPGSGKTTLAYVAALETQSELFELNASDLRNKDRLQEILKPALQQQSLLKKGKIILVDEVDGISAVDRGGLPELLRLIQETSWPIIISANDIWDKKFSELRRKSEIIKLKEIDYNTIKGILFDILKKENKFIDNNIVTKITINAKGDLRAAINDIQTAASMKVPDISEVKFEKRNKETDIFNALKQVFKNKPSNAILGIFDSVNMDIDQIILWIEENIPAEYQNESLEKAFDSLSKVDIFKGRIYKQQYWRFLVYENILLSYGISAAKDKTPQKNKISGFTSYKKPTRILKIWMNNQRTIKKKSIAQKYSKYVHVGQKRAMKEFPIIKQIINSNSGIAKELKLSEEEVEYLKS
ncbi:MAG: replication factor C large subunit [Candidatus Nanoarchaeia archaeon]